MAYINGNLAMQPQRKPQRKQEQYKEVRRVVVKRKQLPVQEKLLYIFAVFAGVTIACIIIFRYAQIYDKNLEIKQLNSNYQKLTIEMEDLKRQAEVLSNPERIRKLAESQGMVSTLDSGITVYIDESKPLESVMNE